MVKSLGDWVIRTCSAPFPLELWREELTHEELSTTRAIAMSGAELALETQLLLQEVTQAKQFEVAVDAEGPPLSEFELAKQALVEKLRKKKEQNRQQLQQRNLKRYGFAGAAAKMMSPPQVPAQPAAQATGNRVTPVKQKQMGLPVIAAAPAASRKKKELLSSLRTQAIKQGSQEMAKLFGYNSYEEHIKHLNRIEKMKILQSEMQENKQGEEGEGPNAVEGGSDGEEADADEDLEMVGEHDGAEDDTSMETQDISSGTQHLGEESVLPAELSVPAAIEVDHDDDATTATVSKEGSPASSRSPLNRRRRNQIQVDDDEEDGNEADSEQDNKDDEEEDKEEAAAIVDDKPKDRAAAFRRLLQEEAKQNRQRKRLRKGADFVESEAEEEEEEDALRIGGLGDFGFGVPQAATKESAEAEAERNALNMREDDLEGIVDDLSDEEKEQAEDLDEIYRRELEEQDRQQVKEVMRNVKEGFGRNRRAFSGLDAAGARGRFNLNELTAADGKLEAARLGLLESDEELMDDDDEAKEKEEENEEAEEEDEEAEMERLLRERFLNQPKIYISSSESEGEEENEVEKAANDTAGEEIESDEERERQQMKLFSERARINRRMQRMKEVQRQVAIENEEEVVKAPLPNLLLEEDEESQELLKVLNRTDVAPAATATTAPSNTSRLPLTARSARPGVKRFSSFGMSSARSSSSFSRVAKNCKLFSTGSGSSAPKGFVFTSFSSDKVEHADENTNSIEDSGAQPSSQPSLAKSQSWGGSGSHGVKRPFGTTGANASSAKGSSKKRKGGKSDFFSVLASYQCVSQDTSAPM